MRRKGHLGPMLDDIVREQQGNARLFEHVQADAFGSDLRQGETRKQVERESKQMLSVLTRHQADALELPRHYFAGVRRAKHTTRAVLEHTAKFRACVHDASISQRVSRRDLQDRSGGHRTQQMRKEQRGNGMDDLRKLIVELLTHTPGEKGKTLE